jgi:uncharacterized DUF497 family protein
MDRGQFEWDAAKAESNLEKHGLSFEAACCVFDDALASEHSDFRKSVTRDKVCHHWNGQ